MSRVKQPERGQLLFFGKRNQAKPPLERDLVDAIRQTIHRLGLIHWTGRMFVHGHRPPYLPVLGPGTPDILGVFSDGRMWGIECKRSASEELRQSQALWKARYPAVLTCCVSSVEEAVEFLKANRG